MTDSSRIPTKTKMISLTLSVRVVCVGGDGSVAEVCHALVLRAQLDANSPEKPVKPVLPLGIIPAGEREENPYIYIYMYTNIRPTLCRSTSIHTKRYQTGGFALLSIFPGSTDVVSCSVHGVRDPVTAALHIVLGTFYLFHVYRFNILGLWLKWIRCVLLVLDL